MKNFFFAIFAFSTFPVLAQDPGVGNAVREFRTGLENGLNATREKMELQISERHLNFSDYSTASKNLLKRIAESQSKFTSELKNIEDFLSTYDTVQNNQGNRAMERLLEKKKEEMGSYREQYLKAAKKFIQLGKLIDPLLQNEEGKIFWGGYDFTRTAQMEVQQLFQVGILETYMHYGRSNLSKSAQKQKMKENLMEDLQEQHALRIKALFTDCLTQGCIYYLAEDYKLWLKEIQKTLSALEIPVKGVDAFIGPEYQVKAKVINSFIDQYADAAASGKPTSL